MKETKYTFKVGDRVGLNESEYSDEFGDNIKIIPLRFNQYDELSIGEVRSLSDKGLVEVEWEEGDHEDGFFDPKKLLPEDVFKAKLSQLQKEFDDVSKDLKAKLKEIAKAIGEADKLAMKTGYHLADMYDVYDSLYTAMDNAGWHTSSFGCS